jgi:2-isopropylmalate synthase
MKIELLDSTLREGEQAPGVSFNVSQKLELAKMIDDFGVEFIELGHPAVSPDVRAAVEALSKLDLNAQKLIHGRATKTDIDDAKKYNVPWVGIFFGTSDLSLQHKFGIDRSTALEKIKDAVCYAKDLGLKLRFTAEDATRTDLDFLIEVGQLVQECGADRFSLADTVGILTPTSTETLVKAVVDSLDIPIHIHCHNDFGLATANVIAAFSAGASVGDVTVNGLGERSGIAPLAEIAMIAKVIHQVDNDWKLETLMDLSRKVERLSGVFNSEHKPIVGQHAFTHKAGLHTRAVLKNPRTYEAYSPELLKRDREITIDKYAGKDALSYRLYNMKIKVNEPQLNEIMQIIKENPDKRKFSDIDLLEIADDVLGVNLKARVPIAIEAIISFELSSALYTTRITRWLMSFEQVKDVYEVAGDYDIIAHISSETIQELNDLVEELRTSEGILRTFTRPILKGYSNNSTNTVG